MNTLDNMTIAFVGHVDHGKSTIIGRLLAETNSLPKGKLERIKKFCVNNSRPFEYAFILDALKNEQSQGITIDSARVFFKTGKRNYQIVDSPGHIDFLRNMITGASRADSAVLVIDALDGVKENTRRHLYLLALLDIKNIIVIVNKMDLIDYDELKFDELKKEISLFFEKLNVTPHTVIPASGIKGDNITVAPERMKWFNGKTILQAINSLTNRNGYSNKPFRMPVQDIYKFTNNNDNRRIVTGMIETGKLNVGDGLLFYPSMKKGKVKSIEGLKEKYKSAKAKQSVGFTLQDQVYLSRGEIAVKEKELPIEIGSKIKANIFWLGKEPLKLSKEYLIKLGTCKVYGRVLSINKVINSSELEIINNRNEVFTNEAAECIIKLNKSIAFDIADNIQETSRFVIIDRTITVGGGTILENILDTVSWMKEKTTLRDYKWNKSNISHRHRSEKYGHTSAMVIITGNQRESRKEIAKKLEMDLFNDGRKVYYLGIGNLLYGVDADIKNKSSTREEHLRRLAEVSHILLDAGMILIITAHELTSYDIEIIKTATKPDQLFLVWLGEQITTDIECDYFIKEEENIDKAILGIKMILRKNLIIK